MDSPLHHYSNWTAQLDRQAAWWDDPHPRRPIACIQMLTDPDKPVAWDGWCFTREPDCPEKHIEAYARFCEQFRYEADAFPILRLGIAPGVLAAGIHGFLEMGESTAWIEKECSWEELTDVPFDEHALWWKRCWRIVKAAIDAGMVCSTVDLGGVVDVVAAVRGTQTLIMDMMDEPERVQDLIARVRALWIAWFDRQADLMFETYGGMTNRWGFFARAKHYPLQCDFAAMLSPKMFEQFVLPDLAALCDHLDYGVYHLDGPEQICHLDMLLSIPNMRLIQWVPGAAHPDTNDPKWFEMYRKIQDAGRALVLGGSLEQVRRYRDVLDFGLLHLHVGVRDEAELDEALQLLDDA